MKQKIIISGFGGQGVMLAGTLLCYAGMREGKYVTFFPSYGAEIRGGTANCQVIISKEPIGAPVVYNPDILIALNKPSFERFLPKVIEGGTILANTSLYSAKSNGMAAILEIPSNNIAEDCGSVLASNIVMLGALAAKSDLIDINSLINSIPDVLTEKKRKLWDLNKKAANKGFSYCRALLKKSAKILT